MVRTIVNPCFDFLVKNSEYYEDVGRYCNNIYFDYEIVNKIPKNLIIFAIQDSEYNWLYLNLPLEKRFNFSYISESKIETLKKEILEILSYKKENEPDFINDEIF